MVLNCFIKGIVLIPTKPISRGGTRGLLDLQQRRTLATEVTTGYRDQQEYCVLLVCTS